MADENVVDYGVNEDGVAFVITEKGAGVNIPRTKYVGDAIPDKLKRQIDRKENAPAVSEANPDKYAEFQNAISKQKVDNPREDYLKDSQPGANLDYKFEKGRQHTDAQDNLHPERFTANQAEDIQINPTDTYQEIKSPDKVEDQTTASTDIDFSDITIPKSKGGI